MNKVIKYSEFNEGLLSTITSFLKSNYNKIFQDPIQSLNNLFNDFIKKVDKEKNVSNLYQKYLRTSQNLIQTEINNAESIDAINKLVSDEIKYFYFTLKPIVNKLQHDEFTIEEIFSRSKDKRLQKLMSYPEDQFSNAVTQYIGEAVTPWIKKDAGLDKENSNQTQQPQQNQNQPQQPDTTESSKYKIYKMLEADEPIANNQTTDEDLTSYKKSAIKWINMSLFDLLKPKMQLLNQLSANTSNTVDNLSKQMKSTNNDNAKKMIINKIMNMDKDELSNLAKTLGLTEDEIGKI